MTPLYPNQPLTSVAIEVRFRGDLKVELCRSKIQERVRDSYPKLLVPNAQQNVAPATQPYRFQDEADDNGFQFSICNIGLFSRSYPGHQEFLREFENLLQMFLSYLGNVTVTRMGWRYVNEIAFTREDDLIPVQRFLGKKGPLSFATDCRCIALSHQMLFLERDSRINVKLESKEHTQQRGHEAIFLDIDAYKELDPNQEMDADKIMWRVRRLHGIAYRLFENSISDQYRNYLKGDLK